MVKFTHIQQKMPILEDFLNKQKCSMEGVERCRGKRSFRFICHVCLLDRKVDNLTVVLFIGLVEVFL
jgi:hypothetical protein